MDVRSTSRSCGPCTACCRTFTVSEVDKLDANWCRHRVSGKGCDIYSNRPYACKAFACMWLNEKGEESDRPDLLSVMMDIKDFEVEWRECGTVHLWEIEEGAFGQPRVQQLAESFTDQGLVVAFHRLLSATATYQNTFKIPSAWFTKDEYRQIAEMVTRGLL